MEFNVTMVFISIGNIFETVVYIKGLFVNKILYLMDIDFNLKKNVSTR